MSVLSDADIIAKNPIRNSLDAVRRPFGEKCKDLGFSEVRQLAETSDIGRDLAFELILALQSIPLSRALRSRIGKRVLLLISHKADASETSSASCTALLLLEEVEH